jgi:hypothetical protein
VKEARNTWPPTFYAYEYSCQDKGSPSEFTTKIKAQIDAYAPRYHMAHLHLTRNTALSPLLINSFQDQNM